MTSREICGYGINHFPPLKDTVDFDDAEFHGFCGDFKKNKDRRMGEIEIEMEGRWGGDMDTLRNDTEGRKSSQMEDAN